MFQIEQLGSAVSKKNWKLLTNALDEAVVALNNNRDGDEEQKKNKGLQTSNRSEIASALSPSKLRKRPARNLRLGHIVPGFDAKLEVENLHDSVVT